MKTAPVVLFAYNRPWHTRRTLLSLKANELADASELFIFIDGPRENADEEQRNKTEEVKKIAREEKWCASVQVIESEFNKGLSASVISGVTDIVNRYGKVIVLEDDLVSDRYFLKFMNNALDAYANDERVVSITGYIYPVSGELPPAFFLKGADCWGWATWKRGWDLLEKDGRKLLNKIESGKFENDFDFNGSYPYTQMLRDQVEGKNNSWAILWYASAYLESKLTLYPGNSLIQNIGTDGSGTHSGASDKWKVDLKGKEVNPLTDKIEENKKAKEIISGYFRNIMGGTEPGLLGKFKSKLRDLLR